eukprot:361399-Chlamydomonas_euryale.AAC.16
MSGGRAARPMHCLVLLQEESSEYETDSEDEVAGRRMLKPLFVPKVAREVGRPQIHTRRATHASEALLSHAPAFPASRRIASLPACLPPYLFACPPAWQSALPPLDLAKARCRMARQQPAYTLPHLQSPPPVCELV